MKPNTLGLPGVGAGAGPRALLTEHEILTELAHAILADGAALLAQRSIAYFQHFSTASGTYPRCDSRTSEWRRIIKPWGVSQPSAMQAMY